VTSPQDTLQAAITRLTELRERIFAGEWEVLTSGIESGDHWYVQSERQAILSVSANDGEDEELRGPTAKLIVTLHRTIDAQIAILHQAERIRWTWFNVNYEPEYDAGGPTSELYLAAVALAESILGDTP
jgi:hypothetical protein